MGPENDAYYRQTLSRQPPHQHEEPKNGEYPDYIERRTRTPIA